MNTGFYKTNGTWRLVIRGRDICWVPNWFAAFAAVWRQMRVGTGITSNSYFDAYVLFDRIELQFVIWKEFKWWEFQFEHKPKDCCLEAYLVDITVAGLSFHGLTYIVDRTGKPKEGCIR